MRLFLRGIICALLLCAAPWFAIAQTSAPPTPFPSAIPSSVEAVLPVTATSARVALTLPTTYPVLFLKNIGPNRLFFLGGSSSVVAVTTNPSLDPGQCLAIWAGGATNIAAITAGSDTATLRITQFNGNPGQSCGGSVTGTPGAPSTVTPIKGSGAYNPATITNSSTQVLAAGIASAMLDIVNESTTATIACAFGVSAAVINGAGSITIPPGWHRSWEGFFVPTDAVNCISSVASSAASVGAK